MCIGFMMFDDNEIKVYLKAKDAHFGCDWAVIFSVLYKHENAENTSTRH